MEENQKIEMLNAQKPEGPEDLFESIRETRAKVNELAKKINELSARSEVTDRALAKTINNFALHKHAEMTGEAMTPLAV